MKRMEIHAPRSTVLGSPWEGSVDRGGAQERFAGGATAVSGGAPFLFIVSPNDTAHYEFVKRYFADECDVEVVCDRRRGERRRNRRSQAHEQRQRDRRRNDVSRDLRAIGWAYVRRLA